MSAEIPMQEDEADEDESCPSSDPGGLFDLMSGRVVSDADEEVMELYMMLASSEDSDETTEKGGLGFIDSSHSHLPIVLELAQPVTSPPLSPPVSPPPGHRRSRHVSGKKATAPDTTVRIELELLQDLTALKGRKGDTGSVLWRSSLYLAKHLLSQYHFPPPHPLLDCSKLKDASVLELGSGTGLLALLLSPLCRRYTASDRLENVRLVQRNLELNRPPVPPPRSPRSAVARDWANVQVEEVDWVDVASCRRLRDAKEEPYDLILAVDCIYNENLLQPLVDTLTYYTSPGRTAVWVVVELRSADVLTAFLEKWLRAGWTVVRLPPDAMGTWDGARPRWVGWVGWRV